MLNSSELSKTIRYVNTGEVCSGGSDTILNSGAIGSCVVITAFNAENQIGAMAHVMLPGTCPVKDQLNATRYAANALEELLDQLKDLKVRKENIEVCIIGGANVLKREKDSIGKDNLDSVERLLSEKKIEIKAKDTGGFERRTVLLDIEKGHIYCTVGDSNHRLFWQVGSGHED